MSQPRSQGHLRHPVFWPAVLLLLAGLIYSVVGGSAAVTHLRSLTTSAVEALALPFAVTAFGSLLICLIVAISPLGGVRLGGPKAERLLQPWNYFSIALCTTVAAGLLFWATAEPLYHFRAPPESLGIAPQSLQAKVFALSTMLQHWTLVPYALYAIPSVLFALTFYNMRQPFSLAACLHPLLGRHVDGWVANVIDSLCLFALVAGMASSLGTGILSLAGGVESLTAWSGGSILLVVLGAAVVASFVLSAVSGLEKGVKMLSDLNAKVFFAIMIAIAVFGPGGARTLLTLQGAVDFVVNLLPRTLLFQFAEGDRWPIDWSIFYWTAWLAWAPVTALFLGRISKGYTVRQMLLFTLLLPSLFVVLWLGILSGSALEIVGSQELLTRLDTQGPGSIVYAIFEVMSGGTILAAIFVLAVFVSYVTAADSNTLAMAGLCWSGISAEEPEPPNKLKIMWGCLVGTIAVGMICTSGVDGIKSLSNLGGIPALLFELASAVSLLLLIGRWKELVSFPELMNPESAPEDR